MVRHSTVVIFVLFLTTLIGFIFIKNKTYFNIKNNTNWKWEDKWSNKDKFYINNKNYNFKKDIVKPKEEPNPKKVSPEEIKINSYEDAINESERTKKPVLLFFTADWCGYCQKMKNNTMKDEKVKDILKNYIVFYIDVDKNIDLSKKYYIKSLPTCIITNHQEKNIKYKKGYVGSTDFYNWLNDSNILK
jgi:thiol:disulfide interchange protein